MSFRSLNVEKNKLPPLKGPSVVRDSKSEWILLKSSIVTVVGRQSVPVMAVTRKGDTFKLKKEDLRVILMEGCPDSIQMYRRATEVPANAVA